MSDGVGSYAMIVKSAAGCATDGARPAARRSAIRIRAFSRSAALLSSTVAYFRGRGILKTGNNCDDDSNNDGHDDRSNDCDDDGGGNRGHVRYWAKRGVG
jgi:hypothetical protein